MSRNDNESTSPEASQTQDNRLHGQSRRKSFESHQLERAIQESSRILKDIVGDVKRYSSSFNMIPTKNKRVPRLYYINNKETILIILQGDITKTKVDAIVNAANEHMTGGSGVDGIIHNAAGRQLRNACEAHKQITRGVRLPTGHSRILLSYDMSSTTYYIINTAGPVYNRHRAAECAEKLSSCYKTALALAHLYDLESIGFTAISCGIFGYPANDGAEVALQTVDKEAQSVPVVVFVLWDDHIYDAWVKKAEELKFILFNSEPSTTTNVSKPSIDENQTETINSPTTTNDEEQSQTTCNLAVRDFSTQNVTPKTPDEEIHRLLKTLPSVPDDSSDTQKTEYMDENDNSTTDNHRSNTVEMTNADPEQEKSTANDDDSNYKSAEEETGKPGDEKSTTNNDLKSSLVHEKTVKSDDEESKK